MKHTDTLLFNLGGGCCGGCGGGPLSVLALYSLLLLLYCPLDSLFEGNDVFLPRELILFANSELKSITGGAPPPLVDL